MCSGCTQHRRGPVLERSQGTAAKGGKRAFLRMATGLLLFAVAALLIWGARWQEPRRDPFETDFLSRVVAPEPHPGYRRIPVVPLGVRLALVERGLCARPNECGSLERLPNGKTHFRDAEGAVQDAAQLHRSTLGHLFALTFSGDL